MMDLVLVVIDVDVSVAIAGDGNVAAAVWIFFLVVVGGARAVVAKARDVAAHLRPPAATADEHQERLSATGAFFLRLTCRKGKKKTIHSSVSNVCKNNKTTNNSPIDSGISYLNTIQPEKKTTENKSLLSNYQNGPRYATEFELVQGG